MLIFIFIFTTNGCNVNSADSSKLLTLFTESDSGKIIPLVTHIERNGVDGCVLVPYQSVLRDAGEHDVNQINQAIKESDIAPSEELWYFLFWDGRSLETLSFDVNSSYEVKQGGFGDEFLILFSKMNFKSISCSKIEKLTFIKYQINDQAYITFGVNEQ